MSLFQFALRISGQSTRESKRRKKAKVSQVKAAETTRQAQPESRRYSLQPASGPGAIFRVPETTTMSAVVVVCARDGDKPVIREVDKKNGAVIAERPTGSMIERLFHSVGQIVPGLWQR